MDYNVCEIFDTTFRVGSIWKQRFNPLKKSNGVRFNINLQRFTSGFEIVENSVSSHLMLKISKNKYQSNW